MQEETCADAEIVHVEEAISYIAITPGRAGRESNGRLYAGVQWQANQMGSNQRVVGEEGYVTSLNEAGDNAWISVELTEDYGQTAPVVLAGLPTQHNEQEVAVRIKDIRLGDGDNGCIARSWCFDIRVRLEPSHRFAAGYVFRCFPQMIPGAVLFCCLVATRTGLLSRQPRRRTSELDGHGCWHVLQR